MDELLDFAEEAGDRAAGGGAPGGGGEVFLVGGVEGAQGVAEAVAGFLEADEGVAGEERVGRPFFVGRAVERTADLDGGELDAPGDLVERVLASGVFGKPLGDLIVEPDAEVGRLADQGRKLRFSVIFP